MKKFYKRMAAMGQVDEKAGSLDLVRDIARKLNESRQLFISLWGLEKLKETVEEYRPVLDAVCRKNGCSVLQALIMILKDEAINREQAMMITAAVTEILDPDSSPNPSSHLLAAPGAEICDIIIR